MWILNTKWRSKLDKVTVTGFLARQSLNFRLQLFVLIIGLVNIRCVRVRGPSWPWTSMLVSIKVFKTKSCLLPSYKVWKLGFGIVFQGFPIIHRYMPWTIFSSPCSPKSFKKIQEHLLELSIDRISIAKTEDQSTHCIMSDYGILVSKYLNSNVRSNVQEGSLRLGRLRRTCVNVPELTGKAVLQTVLEKSVNIAVF